MLAGLAVGVWESLDELRTVWKLKNAYDPQTAAGSEAKALKRWHKAVEDPWVGRTVWIKPSQAQRSDVKFRQPFSKAVESRVKPLVELRRARNPFAYHKIRTGEEQSVDCSLVETQLGGLPKASAKTPLKYQTS